MDIVFLTDSLTRGGAETQLVRIAMTLKQRGWSVGILTMLPLNDFTDDIELAGIPIVHCEDRTPRIPIRMTFRMIRQLRRWRPLALITFNYHADVMGRICGRLSRIPVIIASLRTAHAKTILREKIYRFTEPLIDLTASNSEAAISYMAARGVLTRRKTKVIPNGMITSQFPAHVDREEVRSEFAVAPGTFFWLAVGSLRPAKDYPNLLAAAARCAEKSMDFRLCVAGNGGPIEDLRAEAKRRGLEEVVHFLGGRSDVPRLFKACDAYVLSSAWEGLPNTLMEAMASGVPSLATDVGGVRELIEPGVTGFIVPPRDPEALADRMLSMMAQDPSALKAMGARARERIVENFDNEHVVDQWEDSIKEISAGTPVPRRRPVFIVSLDLELLWGMRDKRSIELYGDHIQGERQAVPAILKMLRHYGVKATWAAVGFLLFDNRRELLQYLPETLPTYARQALDPYKALAEIGADEKSDPYHFGLSLARQILDCPGMELGSHTFSHYYCLEAGQDVAQFRADLAASVAAIERLTDPPVSLVFPRRQCNADYFSACSDAGFKVFRGNESAWMYRATRERDQSLSRRGARLLDSYVNLTGHNGFLPTRAGTLVNCPSSRFLRPYEERWSVLERLRLHRIRSAMEAAARSGHDFHLWWHPHNFGTHLSQNMAALNELLRLHADLRDRHGVVSMTMGEYSRISDGD